MGQSMRKFGSETQRNARHEPSSFLVYDLTDMTPRLREVIRQKEPESVVRNIIEASEINRKELCELKREAMDQHASSEILQLFIEHDRNLARVVEEMGYLSTNPEGIFVYDSYVDLPLHNYCRSYDMPLFAIKSLVKKNPASVQTRGQYRRFPLHLAAKYAHAEVVEFLIDSFPEAVSTTDAHGRLPIQYACQHNAPIEVVQLLIDAHGGTHNGLDQVDNLGKVPLHYAVTSDYKLPMLETVQLLLERHPAGVSTADRNGMTPLHVVCNGSGHSAHPRLLHLLLDTDTFSVLSRSKDGLSPLELVRHSQFHWFNEFTELLSEQQDDAVRQLRDSIHSAGEGCGLPDLVVSTICSFALPRILAPVENEMTW